MVYDKVKELLASQFDTDIDKITRETDIAGDLGADSLDLVEMIMMLEEEFGIVITDESIYAYKTVGEITAFIESMLDKNA
ncbi:acyl carrier protein [Sporobacter termitidis DSM 10068]|uniref:Acyl carrier protein n=1 Tax=Sporobacter termitidis DSM 10068 TaxID=1123282 RepID=A0A1M5YMD0_9FIRM|nr:acyl carrier protein [Sporobacter termitidis]SHI13146.1 acyl carrier protein [Sporobacter termitidis DSM 10068]